MFIYTRERERERERKKERKRERERDRGEREREREKGRNIFAPILGGQQTDPSRSQGKGTAPNIGPKSQQLTNGIDKTEKTIEN